ncbi:flavodoxin domain-containing protein [Arthrobacter oryzae]|uniref:flavodoxin domain-containing protein n=1 Tax=Arthrobacter oryzae TaxID=409290 RepID=UPI0030C8FFAB
MNTKRGAPMKVLVAYASRHGATAGIAERIAADLGAAGLPAEARSVSEYFDAAPYDAFVIGGATYMAHVMKDVTAFVKTHQALLSERPVWLFSSGPLGADRVDAEGHDVLESARPKEFEKLSGLVHTRGEQVFFGAWDPEAPPVGVAERLMKLVPAAKDALPAGDFRDWDAVDAWAAEIAAALKA